MHKLAQMTDLYTVTISPDHITVQSDDKHHQHAALTWTHTPDNTHPEYVDEVTLTRKCHCENCYGNYANNSHEEVDEQGCATLCKADSNCKFALFDAEFESQPWISDDTTVPKCWLFNGTMLPMEYAANDAPQFQHYTCIKKNYCEYGDYVFTHSFEEEFFSVSASMGFSYLQKNEESSTIQALLDWCGTQTGDDAIEMGWKDGDSGVAFVFFQNLTSTVETPPQFATATDTIDRSPECTEILANQYGSWNGRKISFVKKSYLNSSVTWQATYAKASIE
jgi:hypothetical protein